MPAPGISGKKNRRDGIVPYDSTMPGTGYRKCLVGIIYDDLFPKSVDILLCPPCNLYAERGKGNKRDGIAWQIAPKPGIGADYDRILFSGFYFLY